MAKLAELADSYMDAAVRLRMGLEEVKAELETAEGGFNKLPADAADAIRKVVDEANGL